MTIRNLIMAISKLHCLITSWLSEEDRVYPVVARSNVAVENVDVIDLESSYIRSGRPNTKVNIQICLLDMMITSMVVKTAILKLPEHSSILQCQISVKIKELKMLF